MRWPLLLLLLVPEIAAAQQLYVPRLKDQASDPGGACVNSTHYYNTATGIIRCCISTTWVDCGVVGGSANKALGNLSSVAINTTLLPAADNSIDVGSTTLRLRAGHFGPSTGLVIHNDATDTSKASLNFTGSTARLVTDSATPLQLTTGSNTGIKVATSGNVGIGDASAADRLTVRKDGNADVAVSVNNATSGSSASSSLVLYEDSTHFLSFGRNNTGYTLAAGAELASTANSSVMYAKGTGGLFVTSTGPVAFGSGGAIGLAAADERMRILTTGEVGIGTTTPGARLTIDSPSNTNATTAVLSVQDNAGAQNLLKVYGAGLLVSPQVQTVTVVDDGTGAPGAGSLDPQSSTIHCDCQDTQHCDITLAETSAQEGAEVVITAIGTKFCFFPNVANVYDSDEDAANKRGGLAPDHTRPLRYANGKWRNAGPPDAEVVFTAVAPANYAASTAYGAFVNTRDAWPIKLAVTQLVAGTNNENLTVDLTDGVTTYCTTTITGGCDDAAGQVGTVACSRTKIPARTTVYFQYSGCTTRPSVHTAVTLMEP